MNEENSAQVNERFIQELRGASIRVRCDLRGAQLTTFSIGGVLDCLVEVDSLEQLCRVYDLSSSRYSWRVLGAGSNVLLPDEGLREGVLKLGRGFRTLQPLQNGLFEIGAAMSLMSLSRKLSAEGFSGLEFAGGIPASLGGAIAMNAGAHGGEMADIVREVLVWTLADGCCRLSPKEMNFSYRHSNLPSGAVVVGASLQLQPSSADRTMTRRSECLAMRKEAQPLHLPSAGSVFKNPSPDLSAGLLIERAGLKGRSIGGAKISEQHANWIVNEEKKASSADVQELIAVCVSKVQEQSDIHLEHELKCWE